MEKASKFFDVRQAANSRTADIYIFGDISAYRWDESDVSAYSLMQAIKDLDADVIRVHIDSYGGSVSEGWAIYNALREHKARIETYADGFVASAALYPFLAGDERIASPVSAYYLHEVMTYASGYAEDLEKAADEARIMTEIGIAAFVERTGMTADEVRELMSAETWMTPEEALDKGIATKIVTEKADKNKSQSARKAVLQAVFEVQKSKKPEEETPVLKEEASEQAAEAVKTEAKAYSLLEKLSRLHAKKEDKNHEKQ